MQPIVIAHPQWETGILLTTFSTHTAIQGLLHYAKLANLPPITHNEVDVQDQWQPYIMSAFGGYNKNGIIVYLNQITEHKIPICYIEGYTITTPQPHEETTYTPLAVAQRINRKMPPHRQINRTALMRSFSTPTHKQAV